MTKVYFFKAEIGRCINELLVIHAVRPDRLLASSRRLVAALFGDEFMQDDQVVNLREIVENEVIHHQSESSIFGSVKERKISNVKLV